MNKKAISLLLVLLSSILVAISQYDSETGQLHAIGYIAIVLAIISSGLLVKIIRTSK